MKSRPPVPLLRAKRSLGQNFLQDASVLDRILEAAAPGPGDTVLEIGPGKGALTERLLATGARVVAVELDERLRPLLRVLEANHANLRVVWGDIMELSWAELGVSEGALLVANIPYYLTSPLLLRTLGAEDANDAVGPFRRLVLMVQEEVADRLLAQPGTKAWGALTVAVRQRADVARICRVSRGAFRPVPGVDSAVVRLDPLPAWRVPAERPARFRRVVRAVFAQRRKTLRNALRAGGWSVDAVEAACAELDPLVRGETLDLSQLVKVADALPD
ncbi:MAG: 16S rRNA (adenine(1518)-N(6)/adenine(1519)-N(6))-dimethyltransferase RsmA [Candidatus Sericytochromatia bacterium]|nr:16S rRNA (adenine(1518)-N(6)/adenine(1519)-N(6))-dimethyltransferase RsmA [Candidatus Sericytochromatia bacterium]